jgi:hypothetical protein
MWVIFLGMDRMRTGAGDDMGKEGKTGDDERD